MNKWTACYSDAPDTRPLRILTTWVFASDYDDAVREFKVKIGDKAAIYFLRRSTT